MWCGLPDTPERDLSRYGVLKACHRKGWFSGPGNFGSDEKGDGELVPFLIL